MKMKNSLEGIVIKWAFQIDEVLKESSLSLFDKNSHPTPMAELKFWENRRKNVKNIYDQLRDPRVKKIGCILETINSVYFTTFSSTFKQIVTALHEADDITLWLKPLVSFVIKFLMSFSGLTQLNNFLISTASALRSNRARRVHRKRIENSSAVSCNLHDVGSIKVLWTQQPDDGSLSDDQQLDD